MAARGEAGMYIGDGRGQSTPTIVSGRRKGKSTRPLRRGNC